MALQWSSWFYRLFLLTCTVFFISDLCYSQHSLSTLSSHDHDVSDASSLFIDELAVTDVWRSLRIGDLLKSNGSATKTDILTPCSAFQESFADQAASFFKCSAHNARPLRICVRCVGFYERVVNVYSYFNNVSSLCHDELLKADRVQVLSILYNTITKIWSNSYCDDCFSSIKLDDKNGTVSYNLSESTKQFLVLYENITACFNRTNGTKTASDTPLWNSTLCQECRELYKSGNTFFDNQMVVKNRKVCMDIVDMMNHTRKMWGSQFMCTHSNRQDVPIIALTVCLLLTPAILYGGARLWGLRSTRHIVEQKRFRSEERHDLYGSMRSSTPNPNPNGDAGNSSTSVRARGLPMLNPSE